MRQKSHSHRSFLSFFGLSTLVVLAAFVAAPGGAAQADVFVVDTEADVVAADGELSLREAIALANANGEDDVIVFDAGVTRIALGSSLVANEAGSILRVEGDVTLDGQGASQILSFVDNDFELDGLTFENGSTAGDGGGVNADSDSNARLVTNCRFVDCTAIGDGGGAFLDSATNGRFSDLVFTRCIAGGNGGGLAVGDFDDSDRLAFTDCRSGGNGGGLDIDDDGEDLLNCTFTRCTAGGDGGGVNSEDDLDNIVGCTFVDCAAAGNGGAASSDDDVDNVFDSTFTRCSAGGDGGAIFVDANFGEMNDVSFVDCEATGDGGALSIGEDSEFWTSITFTDCRAGGDGGAVFAEDGILLILDGTFRSCEAGDAGGALLVREVNVATVIVSSLFDRNRSAVDGGAISTDATLTLLAVELVDNEAGVAGVDGDGGAIHASIGSTVSLETCAFRRNRAFSDGGAVFSDGTLGAFDTTFEDNRTDEGDGGALFLDDDAVVSVERSMLEGNAAAGDGGALFAGPGSSASFENVTFAGNDADEDGGGILADDPTACDLVDATVARNRAENGGGIFGRDDGGVSNVVSLNSTIVGDNTATTAGDDLFDLAASGGAFDDEGFNLIEDGAGQAVFIDGVNNNIIGVDPGLAASPASNGGSVRTFALGAGSAAVDTGDDGNGVDEDARRFGLSGSNDIGAFELDGGAR